MTDQDDNELEEAKEQGKRYLDDDVKQKIQGQLKTQLMQHAPRLSGYSDRQYFQELFTKFLSVSNDRESFYKELEEFRNHYLVQLVLDVIVDEVLTENTEGSPIIEVSSENEEYDKELKEFFEEHCVQEIVEDILPDLIFYGEYTLSVKAVQGEGVTEIADNVSPGTVVVLYDSILPSLFWMKTSQGDYKAEHISNFVHFSLNSRKHRLSNNHPENFPIKAPMFRVGRSIIWPGIDKLKELKLMEKIRTANLFSNLTSSNLVSVDMPQTMKPNEIRDAVTTYEEMLNSKMNKQFSGSSNELQGLENIIRDSSSIKVVPNLSDKGNFRKVDIDTNKEQSMLQDIQDARETFIRAIGIPVDLIFGALDTKRSSLKQFARYARKIKSIQRSIILSLKQLATNHIAHKFNDTEIGYEDIHIDMKNNLNVDELDNLEGVELVIDSLNETLRFFNEFAGSRDIPGLSRFITQRSEEALARHVKESLASVGFKATDVIDLPEDHEDEPQGDEQGQQESEFDDQSA